MNVVIEDDSKKNNKLKIFYILILVVCIIAVMVTVVIQVSGGEQTISSGKLPELTESEIDKHKNDFYNIFQNKVNYLENNSYKISKVEANEEIIYVGYHNNESKINDFELDVNIPYININNNIIEKFNTQIKEIFEKKAKSILNSQNNNVIYTVNYSAYVSNNILSLIVRKEYTIDEMLEIKGITKKEANQKIKGEIKKAQEKSEELQKLGYSTYARDYTSDMYSINNVTEYFIGKDNALYIIYAYGNENNTNEMDVVVM